MNIYFALSSCVLCTTAFSILFRGRIGYQELVFGIIGGAILAGPVAGTLSNIGSFMALGFVAALINVFYYSVIYPKINSQSFFDVNGIVYILIISFLATFVISPLVLRGMYLNGVTSVNLDYVPITSPNIAGYVLGYVGISIGIALGAGLITGGILKCFEKEHQQEFDDKLIFDPHSGLYHASAYEQNQYGQYGAQQQPYGVQQSQSAANLRQLWENTHSLVNWLNHYLK